jgi:hypothetical protein
MIRGGRLHGHFRWVTTKLGDVGLHPLQGQAFCVLHERNTLEQSAVYSTVLQAEVPNLLFSNFFPRHETERCKNGR